MASRGVFWGSTRVKRLPDPTPGWRHKYRPSDQVWPSDESNPFPSDLIELVQPAPSLIHAVEDHGQASARLEGVYPGARNESLFLAVRLWAYKQRRGSDLESWCQWVEYFTLESNLRLPVPLPEREASATAYSVATWIWSELDETSPAKGKRTLDHSSIAQAWRGTWSGESRRPGSLTERQPWADLGISRATWYRRRIK